MMDPLFSLLGIKTTHVVAAFLGGIVRVLILPYSGFLRSVAAVLAGLIIGGYGTPIALPMAARLGWIDPSVSAEGMVGAALGMIGMSVCEGIITMGRKWRQNPTLPPSGGPIK